MSGSYLPVVILSAIALCTNSAFAPLSKNAKIGEKEFTALEKANAYAVMPNAVASNNTLYFKTLTDFWCYWKLTDRPRKVALLIDDMQIEYEPYVQGIIPQTQDLIRAFRARGMPIFWSAWWRWGPDDGFFNAMDRFYGPIGAQTELNALYNHKKGGGAILTSIGPVTEEEQKRVMHKSYSLDMFDERPMGWKVPAGQGTLNDELQKLGVDTVVQIGAWTDDCIISTAFHAFSLQYDVVVVSDAVSTASKMHFPALDVMKGAAAKIHTTNEVVDYMMNHFEPADSNAGTAMHTTNEVVDYTSIQKPALLASAVPPSPVSLATVEETICPKTPVLDEVARLSNTVMIAALGVGFGYLLGRNQQRKVSGNEVRLLP